MVESKDLAQNVLASKDGTAGVFYVHCELCSVHTCISSSRALFGALSLAGCWLNLSIPLSDGIKLSILHSQSTDLVRIPRVKALRFPESSQHSSTWSSSVGKYKQSPGSKADAAGNG